MTGYVRQSSADIIPGAEVTAAPLNNEFNRLQDAFHATTGHNHQGGTGNGPKLSLTAAVTGVLPLANGGTNSSTIQGSLDNLFDGTTYVVDDNFLIADNADTTKKMKFEVSGITTGTTRTWTIPDSNVTVTSFAATLLDDVDAATMRTTLGLVIGTNVQAFDATLTALAAYNTNGLLTQTAADTFAGRTLTGTSDRITISNGNGVSGNPTVDIASTYVGQSTITTLGTISTGTWQATAIGTAYGGTGATTVSGARTNLGVAIGTDVQAYSANLDGWSAIATSAKQDADAALDAISGLATTDGNFIVGNGSAWVAESGATARTSLGLGSIATQASSSVTITGGSITGITDLTIADGGTGASTASGAFTNLKQAATTSATGVVELATAAEYRSDAAGDLALTSEKVWDAVDPVALSDAATVSWDMSTGIDFSVTIAGNRTLGNPTSTTVGKKGRIKVTASGANRTLDKGSNLKSVTTFPITITSGTSAYLYYDCVSSTEIIVSVINGVS